jgi:hypothetical protein
MPYCVRLDTVCVAKRRRREDRYFVLFSFLVNRYRIPQRRCDRFVNKDRLPCLEDLQRLLQVQTTIVCLEKHNIALAQQILDRVYDDHTEFLDFLGVTRDTLDT